MLIHLIVWSLLVLKPAPRAFNARVWGFSVGSCSWRRSASSQLLHPHSRGSLLRFPEVMGKMHAQYLVDFWLRKSVRVTQHLVYLNDLPQFASLFYSPCRVSIGQIASPLLSFLIKTRIDLSEPSSQGPSHWQTDCKTASRAGLNSFLLPVCPLKWIAVVRFILKLKKL